MFDDEKDLQIPSSRQSKGGMKLARAIHHFAFAQGHAVI
jgi:hypothetical protein